LGVVHTLPISNGIIVDTGGASVELVWVKNGRCAQRVSLPLGSVLLSQTYHLEDQIQASDLFSAMTRFEKELAGVSWLRQVHNLPLIALGGSNRTIAKVYRRQVTDDADDMPDIHDLHLPASYVADLFSRLLRLDQAGRMQIPGLAKNRADVIIGGLIPINLLLRNLQIGEVIFSNHGLRDGLLYEFLAAQKKS
jgi:exopolyphosphatase/guanosine-5'-triphosphate,3'-diphosphate pyrophosphatase